MKSVYWITRSKIVHIALDNELWTRCGRLIIMNNEINHKNVWTKIPLMHVSIKRKCKICFPSVFMES